jgi:hypothetical protein
MANVFLERFTFDLTLPVVNGPAMRNYFFKYVEYTPRDLEIATNKNFVSLRLAVVCKVILFYGLSNVSIYPEWGFFDNRGTKTQRNYGKFRSWVPGEL